MRNKLQINLKTQRQELPLLLFHKRVKNRRHQFIPDLSKLITLKARVGPVLAVVAVVEAVGPQEAAASGLRLVSVRLYLYYSHLHYKMSLLALVNSQARVSGDPILPHSLYSPYT